jgi:single-stranded DNA-binding protein
MHSQLYLTGRIASLPELSQTQKGKLIVKLLLETELVRSTTPGHYQAELVTLQVRFFSREAEAVRDAQVGDQLVVGTHLYPTRFETPDGKVNHGIQIVVDRILQMAARQRGAYQ